MLYHSSYDSKDPYNAFIKCICSTFTQFSVRTFCVCSGFTSHNMSTNSPSIFCTIIFFLGMFELRYAPVTFKMATPIPQCELIMRLINGAYKYIVGGDASSLGMQYICVLPSTHALPFNFPCFTFIEFIARSIPFLWFLRLSGISAPITLIFSRCMYYFYIDSIARSPCIFIPLLGFIYVSVTSTSILCMSCVNSWSFLFIVLVNCVPYFFLLYFNLRC